jgi:hypothetical protein
MSGFVLVTLLLLFVLFLGLPVAFSLGVTSVVLNVRCVFFRLTVR